MKAPPRQREAAEIILLPLINRLLMLSILFMPVTRFKHAAEISINLPPAAQPKIPVN